MEQQLDHSESDHAAEHLGTRWQQADMLRTIRDCIARAGIPYADLNHGPTLYPDAVRLLSKDAALGRQVREDAAAMGVEPGRVGEVLRSVDKLHGTAHAWRSGGMSCGQAMRRVDDILARLSPAPERDAAPTRCLNCDNDIETGGCRCPLQGSPS